MSNRRHGNVLFFSVTRHRAGGGKIEIHGYVRSRRHRCRTWIFSHFKSGASHIRRLIDPPHSQKVDSTISSIIPPVRNLIDMKVEKAVISERIKQPMEKIERIRSFLGSEHPAGIGHHDFRGHTGHRSIPRLSDAVKSGSGLCRADLL